MKYKVRKDSALYKALLELDEMSRAAHNAAAEWAKQHVPNHLTFYRPHNVIAGGISLLIPESLAPVEGTELAASMAALPVVTIKDVESLFRRHGVVGNIEYSPSQYSKKGENFVISIDEVENTTCPDLVEILESEYYYILDGGTDKAVRWEDLKALGFVHSNGVSRLELTPEKFLLCDRRQLTIYFKGPETNAVLHHWHEEPLTVFKVKKIISAFS